MQIVHQKLKPIATMIRNTATILARHRGSLFASPSFTGKFSHGAFITGRSLSTATRESTNLEDLPAHLEKLAPSIAESLVEKGYFTTIPLLDHSVMDTLREQAVALRQEGRYEQSWSEKIQEHNGQVIRFDKPGVFACEPDGADYDTAPDLVTYTSHLITNLPSYLNIYLPENVARISKQAFNAKLAYTESHSEYPLHVDNSLGLSGGDTRKLTCILYLNPEYDREAHKGELRVHLLNDEFVDLEPSTRFVCFWTDEIPHKVLMTGDSQGMDRYALTIWLADEEPQHIHNSSSKFAELRIQAFDKGQEGDG